MISTHFSKIRQNILAEISKANSEILVAVYWFTNQELFDVLIEKLKNGVKVQLIIHNDFINNRETGLRFQELISNGGGFYFSSPENPMHNKFCVIDNKVLINGSYNWTYFAEDKNRENILIIKDELSVIDKFVEEFERLISLTIKLEKIITISKFEIGINDELDQKEYLAQDLLFKASKEHNNQLIQQAFELIPNSIKIQKLANKLNLIPKNVLKYDISLSLEKDEIKYLAKKGDLVPSIFTTIVRTSFDGQTKSTTKILYGFSQKASENKELLSLSFEGIPVLPKGQAEMKFTFSIDIKGIIAIEQLCLQNGKKVIKNIKNTNLIQEAQSTF